MSDKPETPTVELSAFIEVALVSIANGISSAQEKLEKQGKGARVNPDGVNYSDHKKSLFLVNASDRSTDLQPRVELVEFDIAVTSERHSSTTSGGEGGVDIKVVSSKLGTEFGKQHQDSVASRIKFSVPFLLPRG